MMFEWAHIKEYVVVVFTAIVGIMGYKYRQKDKSRLEHEEEQNKRITNLERRAFNAEKHIGIFEERTRNIQDELVDLKKDLRDDYHDIKSDLKVLLHEKVKRDKE